VHDLDDHSKGVRRGGDVVRGGKLSIMSVVVVWMKGREPWDVRFEPMRTTCDGPATPEAARRGKDSTG
jgi:hypothetical protein